MRRGDLAKYLMLQRYQDVMALGVVPAMTMRHVGIVADAQGVSQQPECLTTSIHMETFQDLSKWSVTASAQQHVFALGRLLYLWICCAHAGVILGDPKAANWGCLVDSTDLEKSRLVMLDLRSVYAKSPDELCGVQSYKHVRSFMTSFPGAPKELPVYMEQWWQANTTQSRLPSMIAARKIENGLVVEGSIFRPLVSPHHSRAKRRVCSSGNCPTNLNLPGQLPDEHKFAPNFNVVIGNFKTLKRIVHCHLNPENTHKK